MSVNQLVQIEALREQLQNLMGVLNVETYVLPAVFLEHARGVNESRSVRSEQARDYLNAPQRVLTTITLYCECITRKVVQPVRMTPCRHLFTSSHLSTSIPFFLFATI